MPFTSFGASAASAGAAARQKMVGTRASNEARMATSPVTASVRAYPGEADTGSPTRTCANALYLEPVPIPSEHALVVEAAPTAGVRGGAPSDRAAFRARS